MLLHRSIIVHINGSAVVLGRGDAARGAIPLGSPHRCTESEGGREYSRSRQHPVQLQAFSHIRAFVLSPIFRWKALQDEGSPLVPTRNLNGESYSQSRSIIGVAERTNNLSEGSRTTGVMQGNHLN